MWGAYMTHIAPQVMHTYQDTWSCISSQERYKAQSMLFTASGKSLISTLFNSKTTWLIFTKCTCFTLHTYVHIHDLTYASNLKEIWLVVHEIYVHFQKLPNFLLIYFFALLLKGCLNHVKIILNLPMNWFLSELVH